MESNKEKRQKRKFNKNEVEDIVDIIILPSIGKGKLDMIILKKSQFTFSQEQILIMTSQELKFRILLAKHTKFWINSILKLLLKRKYRIKSYSKISLILTDLFSSRSPGRGGATTLTTWTRSWDTRSGRLRPCRRRSRSRRRPDSCSSSPSRPLMSWPKDITCYACTIKVFIYIRINATSIW